MSGNYSSLVYGAPAPPPSEGDSSTIFSSTDSSSFGGVQSFPYGLEISFWQRLHGRIIPNPLSLESFTDAVMNGELGKFFVVPQIRRIAQECRDSLLERGDWAEMEQVLVNGKKNDIVQGIRQAVHQLCAQQHNQHQAFGYLASSEEESQSRADVCQLRSGVHTSSTALTSSRQLLPQENRDDYHKRNGLASLVAISRAPPSLTTPQISRGRGCGIGRGRLLSVSKKNSETTCNSSSCGGENDRSTGSSMNRSASLDEPISSLGGLRNQAFQNACGDPPCSNAGYASFWPATGQSLEKLYSTSATLGPMNVFTTNSSSTSWMEDGISCSLPRVTNTQRKTLLGLNRRASAFFRVLGLVKLLTLRYGSAPVKFQVPAHFLSGVQSRALRLYILPFTSNKEESTALETQPGTLSTTSSAFSSSTYANYSSASGSSSSIGTGHKNNTYTTTNATVSSEVVTIHPHRWPALKDFVIYINKSCFQSPGWKRTWPERAVEVAKSLLPLDITHYLSFGTTTYSGNNEDKTSSPPQQLKIDILQKDFTSLAAICVVQTFTVDEVIKRILLRELGAADAEVFHKFTAVLLSSSSAVPSHNSQGSTGPEYLEKNAGEDHLYREQRVLRLLNRGQVYALYRRIIEEEDQGEVILGAGPTVSTYCPLTRGPLTIPVRGVFCSHVQCVDLRNYLLHCQVGGYWNCVVCDAEMREEHICIDSVFWEYLNSLVSNTHVSHQEGASLPPRVQLSRQLLPAENPAPFLSPSSSCFEVGKVSLRTAALPYATEAETVITPLRKDNCSSYPQYEWSLIKSDGVKDIVVEDSSDSDESQEGNIGVIKGNRIDHLYQTPPSASPHSHSPLLSSLSSAMPLLSPPHSSTASAGSSFFTTPHLLPSIRSHHGDKGVREIREDAEEIRMPCSSTYSLSPPIRMGEKRPRESELRETDSDEFHPSDFRQERAPYKEAQRQESMRPYSTMRSSLTSALTSSADYSPTLEGSLLQAEEGTAANPIELQ